ncbi:MAG: SurA N-terminal domain-containing protein [Candidatus Nanoarchaeia archaeon]
MKIQQKLAVFFSLFFAVLIAGCSAQDPMETVVPEEGDNPTSEDSQNPTDETTPTTEDTTASPDDVNTQNSQETTEQNLDEVVARVNGEEVQRGQVVQSQQSLMQQGQEASEEQVLDQVIGQLLLTQEVENQGIEVNDEEAEEAIEQQLSMQGMSLDDYRAQVESQGQSFDQEFEQIKQSLAVQEYVDELTEDMNVEVTEEEINQYYESFQAQMGEEAPPLEQVEPQIIEAIESESEQEVINEKIEELKAEADIEYM